MSTHICTLPCLAHGGDCHPSVPVPASHPCPRVSPSPPRPQHPSLFWGPHHCGVPVSPQHPSLLQGPCHPRVPITPLQVPCHLRVPSIPPCLGGSVTAGSPSPPWGPSCPRVPITHPWGPHCPPKVPIVSLASLYTPRSPSSASRVHHPIVPLASSGTLGSPLSSQGPHCHPGIPLYPRVPIIHLQGPPPHRPHCPPGIL